MKIVAAIIFGLVMGEVFGALSMGFGLSFAGVPNLLIVLSLSFLCIFIHEMGHAIVAQRLGARIERIFLFPFVWRRGERRITLARRGKDRVGELAGYVQYRLDTINARRKHIWIAAAGPAANLLTAIIATFFLFVLPVAKSPPPPRIVPIVGHVAAGKPAMLPDDAAISVQALLEQRNDALAWPRALLIAFAILSLGIAVSNLLPFEGSDGNTILRGIRKQRRFP